MHVDLAMQGEMALALVVGLVAGDTTVSSTYQ